MEYYPQFSLKQMQALLCASISYLVKSHTPVHSATPCSGFTMYIVTSPCFGALLRALTIGVAIRVLQTLYNRITVLLSGSEADTSS